MAAVRARQRTYTTVENTSGPKKSGVYPAPTAQAASCSCPTADLSQFCVGKMPEMNFHDRFARCAACPKRPAARVCCRCWQGFCSEHAAEHHARDKTHHVMVNYEIWNYDRCFWCYKCNGHVLFEPYDKVLEPLFLSKGSFCPTPMTSTHDETFAHAGLRCGASTMQGWRADNEDAHIVNLGLNSNRIDLLAVFDGHGGPLVARFVAEHFVEMFDRALKTQHSNTVPVAPDATLELATALTRTFLAMDEAISASSTPEETGTTGTTACVVALNRPNKRIVCANAGDTRAVLCRGSRAVELSHDHRPSVPTENARIVASGSAVFDDRVDGMLAVSRAFGDFEFKQAAKLPPQQQAVTCAPEVLEFEMNADDSFIIVACDGVWDCMTSQEVVTFVLQQLKSGSDPTKAAVALLNHCVAKELPDDGIGTDNMTAVILSLPQVRV